MRRVFSGSPYEPLFSYCRAIRVGQQIFVAGTTAVAEGGAGIVGPGDPVAQARRCFAIIEAALGELGAGLDTVVRTRMFVTDISFSDAIGRVHGEVFRGRPPVATMVEVARLIDPAMMIEIEVDAVVAE